MPRLQKNNRRRSPALLSAVVAVRAALPSVRRGIQAAATLIGCLLLATSIFAIEVELPVGEETDSISIRGGNATSWKQGGYEVYVLRNGCEIRQGDVSARGNEGVLWVDRAESFSGRASRVIAYVEGDVLVNFGRKGDPHSISDRRSHTLVDRSWLGRFNTTSGITLGIPVAPVEPSTDAAIVERGRDARRRELAATTHTTEVIGRQMQQAEGVRQAQFTAQELAPPTVAAAPVDTRRLNINPRSNTPFQVKTFNHPTRDEQVTILSAGVQVVVEGLDQVGTVTLETDRLVIWSPRLQIGKTGGGGLQLQEAQYEFYMEGNVVFRQGDRVIYADRMFYNVARESGVVLNAEILTPVPDFQGLVRLKAEVLQQVDKQHFQAYGAALTTSRIGIPRYWLQSQSIMFEDQQQAAVDPFTGQPLLDPATGSADVEHRTLATANNNFIYFGGVPVFYFPTIATDLTNPAFFIDNIRFKQDQIFGTQIQVDTNLYQLLGIQNRPEGTRLTLSTDYFSLRGPALGTNFSYQRPSVLGIPGPATGFIDAWGIYDTGLDTLSADQRLLPPEHAARGRVIGQHRQYLENDWRFTAELGYLSDRNFQQQYFLQEFDTFKDATTGLELKKTFENQSFSLVADVRLNDFYTQTEQLPRADHFLIGGSVLFDFFSYNAHSHAGYLKLRTADVPENAIQQAKFDLLPGEVEQEGVVAATRQSLELPLQAGPVKIVPYVLGEAAFWGNDVTGDDLSRLYGQAGVRASTPVWSVNPDVNSELLNLRGLAHKMVFEAEYFAAAANQDFTQIPRYEQIDDDAQETFRRRLKFNTFGLPAGTPVPAQFDDRRFAIRSGLQDWVTSPSTELADDLQLATLGVRNRWQTKRGLPGQERIIDLVTLDLQAMFYPDKDRDNFGEAFGMATYDFRWHIGDRFSILSDGYSDFFPGGLQQYTVGGVLSRPTVGNLYLGYRKTDGPFMSSLVIASTSYRLSEKYQLNAATSFDLGATGNIGQTVSLTRIGEAFLVQFGFNVDSLRNNVGLQFSIEPRIMPKGRLTGGILPAGAEGIE